MRGSMRFFLNHCEIGGVMGGVIEGANSASRTHVVHDELMFLVGPAVVHGDDGYERELSVGPAAKRKTIPLTLVHIIVLRVLRAGELGGMAGNLAERR